jgi:aerotaxis receptor
MKTNLPVTQKEVPFPKGRYIVSRTDLKGAITYANDTFVDLSGFGRDELMGKNHNIVRHPDMPPAAFQNLWDTLRDGRPWQGIVKNRCKNGDHYWVEALVVPVRKDDQTIGYMSVRTEPSREQIVDAENLYRQLNASGNPLPVPSGWQKVPICWKQRALVGWIIAAQVVGAGLDFFGTAIGLSGHAVSWAIQGLGATTVAAAIALLFQQEAVTAVIRQIIGRLDHVAQGNLTDAIPLHRVDELGKLNDGLVTMQTHLKSMMAEIAEAADTVGDSAQRLTQEMLQTRDVTYMQADATTSIAAAVEELVTAVHEIADSASQASQAVDASHDVLAEAAQRMVDSQTASRNVVTTVDSAGQAMAELFQSIFAINQVSQVIREIADQTNLLALNAAIEAARAGESGRGFAVVADEVRKLAEKSGQQTTEITSSIKEIQRITQIAVTTMEAAGSQVNGANEALDSVRSGLDSVSRQGMEVGQISRHIADGTRQQSAAGDEIAKQVEGIAAGVEQTSRSISAVTDQSQQMHGASVRLRELISYFEFIR